MRLLSFSSFKGNAGSMRNFGVLFFRSTSLVTRHRNVNSCRDLKTRQKKSSSLRPCSGEHPELTKTRCHIPLSHSLESIRYDRPHCNFHDYHPSTKSGCKCHSKQMSSKIDLPSFLPLDDRLSEYYLPIMDLHLFSLPCKAL